MEVSGCVPVSFCTSFGTTYLSICLYLRLEGIATRVEGIATRLEAIATRVEAIATRVEGIAIRLEGIAIRLEGIAIRLEGIAIRLEGIAYIYIYLSLSLSLSPLSPTRVTLGQVTLFLRVLWLQGPWRRSQAWTEESSAQLLQT